MTDLRAALLATIRAAPWDDGPRLVYADWLEEQGESERAEFIRVQVELANYFAEVGCGTPRVESLRRRELELWEANAADWMPHLTGASQYAIHASSVYEGSGTYAVQFGAGHVGGLGRVEMLLRRGFGESVRCNWSDWRDHAGRILAAHPVTQVELTTMPDMEELSHSRSSRTRRFRLRASGKTAQHEIPSREYNNLDNLRPMIIETLLSLFWPGIRFTLPSDTLTLTARRLATMVQVPAELLRNDTDGLTNSMTYAAARAEMEQFDRRIWRALIGEQDRITEGTR